MCYRCGKKKNAMCIGQDQNFSPGEAYNASLLLLAQLPSSITLRREFARPTAVCRLRRRAEINSERLPLKPLWRRAAHKAKEPGSWQALRKGDICGLKFRTKRHHRRSRGKGVPGSAACVESFFATGIGGLDDILGGGLARNHLYLLEGDPGTGKTTIAVQFLMEGARLRTRRGSSGHSPPSQRLSFLRSRIRTAGRSRR